MNWAVKEFDLKEAPAPDITIQVSQEKLQSKSAKKSKYSELENKYLFTWFTRVEANQAVVTDKLLREKALEIASELRETEFKASSNWLVLFKKRRWCWR